MGYIIQAACGCDMGRIRKNNEDNFFFDGKCLGKDNNGLTKPIRINRLRHGFCVAVFDGMGGENFGELASYVAAHHMQLTERSLSDIFIPKEEYLEKLALQLNDAVVEAQKEMHTEHMGTTMVSLYFWGRYAYVCNVGDSRAYRLHNGEITRISVDHVEQCPGREEKKAPLTQHLGFGSEEIQIEPYITKRELKKGDIYLLCSDGLTDMLTDLEIFDIVIQSESVESCVQDLIVAACEHGGRDNITVIVCKLN